MKRRLGPKAGLAVAVFAAVVGLALTWSTFGTQQVLRDRGVTTTAQVVNADTQRAGRISFDTIDVRIPGYPDPITTDRFTGSPPVGDRITVTYDRNDPTTLVEAGVSPWGPIELFMAFFGVAGAVCAVIEWRRIPRRRRARGRIVVPTSPKDGSPKPRPNPWAGKPSKHRGARST